MKKIFTLIVMAIMAIGANAQEKALFSNDGAYGNGATLTTENASVVLGNDRSTKNYDIKLSGHKAYCADFAQTVMVKNEDTGEMEEKSRVVYVVGNQNPKDGELDGDKSTGSGYNADNGNLPKSGTYYMLTATKPGTMKAFIVLNSGKSLFVAKQSDGTCLPNSALTLKADGDEGTVVELADDRTASEKVTGTIEFAVAANETYYLFCTGSKLSFGGYIFTPGEGGGESPIGDGADSYRAIEVDGDGNISLESEFLAVVNENGEATNVNNGKSIVNVYTDNVTMEAVGGSTPANVDGGAQDITPGAAMPDYVDPKGEAHPYAHAVASVGSWAPIKWENKNNKTDINDAAGTKIYILMGTGNPYINMLCEEIVTDDAPTGRYRAIYEYYKPGMDLPEVGLYYKFTTKVDGKMKVMIWANKGNRNTYLINGQTKEAVPYKAEGYINGQRANDETRPVLNEDGTPKLDNDGNPVYEQYQIYFTADEIQRIHDEAKLNDQGEDTAPYVIAAGNQAFWGWITFDAKAGVDYWLFQDSSQVGFGGFEFNAGGTNGIENVQAVKVQDNRMFNLQGQVVGNDYKGIVIMNGKKFIKK